MFSMLRLGEQGNGNVTPHHRWRQLMLDIRAQVDHLMLSVINFLMRFYIKLDLTSLTLAHSRLM